MLKVKLYIIKYIDIVNKAILPKLDIDRDVAEEIVDFIINLNNS